MSKFLYSRFHEKMEEDIRANSIIAGGSERSPSILNYNKPQQQ